MNENDRQAPGLGVCHKIDDNDLMTSVDKLMLIRSTNHRTENLINKANQPIQQPLTNPGQVNLPFLLLGMMEWLVVAEAWFKVNERSNETVDLGNNLVPEIERRSSSG
jgi:hypothetical protein